MKVTVNKPEPVVVPPTTYSIELTQEELEHLVNLLYIGTNTDDRTIVVYDGEKCKSALVKKGAAKFYDVLHKALAPFDDTSFAVSFEGYEND